MRKIFVTAAVAALLFAGDLMWSQPASADPLLPNLATTIGEVNVGFAKGLLPNVQVGGLLGGLPVLRRTEETSFMTLKAPNLDVVRRALALIPGVTYVEDNALMHTEALPNDPLLTSGGSNQQYGPQHMGFPAAWDSIGFGTTAITVALIDSGILKTHEDLTGGRVLQGHDYVNNDSDPDDTCGHGTHTAGILGATTNNGKGIAGGAQINILEMKALQMTKGLFGLSSSCSGSNAGIAQAIIDAANQGAKVISMSIGGGSNTTLANAVDYAIHTKGAVLVAAAGNDGGANSIDYPGAYPDVVTVGALDQNDVRASYSDGGAALDIMAPGSNVISTYTGANNATYALLSGTSMATPGVAGAIALALGCAPVGTTGQDVVNALYATAQPLGGGTPAAANTTYGHGLARADSLAQQVCNGTPPPPPVNHAPVAAFTATGNGPKSVAVNGASSSDPDPGDSIASYAWDFGDGGTATGVSATHTYANTDSVIIKLTVTDTHGLTATASTPFTPVDDPDPGAPTINSAQVVTIALSAANPDVYYKILVPPGKSQIQAQTGGPGCGVFGFGSCSVDLDLYTRAGARPTDSTFACHAATKGPTETCTTAAPAQGYWFLRVKRIGGSGNVTLTAKIT